VCVVRVCMRGYRGEDGNRAERDVTLVGWVDCFSE